MTATTAFSAGAASAAALTATPDAAANPAVAVAAAAPTSATVRDLFHTPTAVILLAPLLAVDTYFRPPTLLVSCDDNDDWVEHHPSTAGP